MYNVTLSKVLGGSRVRTETVTGMCENYPVIGESFAMVAESLTFGLDLRIVRTSPVKNIDKQDNIIVFETENSTYQLLFN